MAATAQGRDIKTRDPAPETRDPEATTRDPAPGARTPEAKDRDPEATTRDPVTRGPIPCLPEPIAACPGCHYSQSRIYATRSDEATLQVRRYRQCQRCHQRFVTWRAMTETEAAKVAMSFGGT